MAASAGDSGLPLRRGDAGDAVRDLQTRLAELGFSPDPDEHGWFGECTSAAVCAFQQKRGLRADGACGPQTWGGLVEAGYRPGDRLLYYASPFLRGDDVAALQRRLGALGFDPGRVDGILGEQTQRGIVDFQRNAGLPVDAVCGPATLEALGRLSGRTDHEPVGGVRERDTLRRSPPTLSGRTVVVGGQGGLDALVQAVAQALAASGARVIPLQHPDPSAQAAHANGLGADLYVGLASAADGCMTAYYAAHGYESPGGRRLADRIQQEVPPVLGAVRRRPEGMSIPVLRETRMAAVACELGPPTVLVEKGAALAVAFRRACEAWAAALDQL